MTFTLSNLIQAIIEKLGQNMIIYKGLAYMNIKELEN